MTQLKSTKGSEQIFSKDGQLAHKMILIIKSLSKCKSKPQRGTFTPTRMTKTNGTNSMFWQESSEIRIFIHP